MPTRDTKEGLQKTSLAGRLKALRDSVTAYRKNRKDELFRYSVLVLVGFLSALIIQDPVVALQESGSLGYFLGSFLLITFILFIFFKDIKRYKPAYLNDNKMMLLLGILITGTLLQGRLFGYLLSGFHRGFEMPVGESFVFGIPLPVGAVLVALMFDFHLAIIFSFVMSLLAGIWFYNPFYPVYAFVGSLTAAFCVFRCKRRSTLIKAGFVVSVVSVITVAVILFMKGDVLGPTAPSTFLFAAISGILVSSVVSIVLPVIEYIFGIKTDISLVELLDHDQPLMRSLMVNAPGTYHHSVIVGNLVESAAEAVGANPLLARVSAHYHDIGKMKMPEYFIENQGSSNSKHDKLAPTLSSMILINHVKEGVELARQHKLPQQVIDIIQQHHGTSLMTFFYQKAKELKPEAPPLEDNYRYPGPRPQTRVAALVMMADAVEAASRTLNEPTPARIAALVEKIINNVYLAGQIDECELTLKDISEIKKRFTFILTTVLHRRIEYPELQLKKMEARDERGAFPHGNGSGSKGQTKTDKDRPPVDREPHQEGRQAPAP